MEKEKPNKPGQEKKEGYIIIPNYFLREYIKVLGVGPAMFYQYLLTYCHKNKNTAWPSLLTSSKDTGITKKTLTKYYRILIKYGLIKKFSKKKLSSDGYMRNIYQLTPLNGEKITLHRGNFYHNIGVKITPDVGKKLLPNNTNLNITNITAAKGGKDAAVVAVDFKKLKEKGEEEKIKAPYNSDEHYTGQAIRERMVKLDFKQEFIEKTLKEYSAKRIEETLDLLLVRKNVRRPAAWLRSALKNDYRGEEPSLSFPQPSLSFPRRRESSGCHDESRIDSRFRGNDKNGSGNPNCRGRIHSTRLEPDKNMLSTEEARERFHSLREKLKAMK